MHVADGVNVGYDIYRIKTEVSENGVTVKAGHDYQKRDRLTRAKRWEPRKPRKPSRKTQLDCSVVVPDQIRTVIRTLPGKLFHRSSPTVPPVPALGPDEPGCPRPHLRHDDSHAEETSSTLSARSLARNDFCKKVTYRASGKSEDIIKAFRTAPEFRIAVTVDMIATGTDIASWSALPSSCAMSAPSSTAEQMKGRAPEPSIPTPSPVSRRMRRKPALSSLSMPSCHRVRTRPTPA
ncbi:MAG: hypothetical protein H7A54_10090 [Akkermansiaceae bacterium]|nr:hypothetical protein [Akkermansiaceae bacterium]